MQKFGGRPLKMWRAKNMQNFGRFYTTSDFDPEYLRNETRYQKLERHVISSDFSRVQPNKFGELWSTIRKVVHVSLDPPKLTFSTDYISAPSYQNRHHSVMWASQWVAHEAKQGTTGRQVCCRSWCFCVAIIQYGTIEEFNVE